MGQQLDKVKRKAAGQMCLCMFGLASHLSYQMGRIAATGIGPDSLGQGLTEEEQERVKKLASHQAALAEHFRKLGWRLQGRKS